MPSGVIAIPSGLPPTRMGRPARFVGSERIEAVEIERTAVDGDGRAYGTGELELLPADLVVRSVGYRGVPLPAYMHCEAACRQLYSR